jgi:hypothetical protein
VADKQALNEACVRVCVGAVGGGCLRASADGHHPSPWLLAREAMPPRRRVHHGQRVQSPDPRARPHARGGQRTQHPTSSQSYLHAELPHGSHRTLLIERSVDAVGGGGTEGMQSKGGERAPCKLGKAGGTHPCFDVGGGGGGERRKGGGGRRGIHAAQAPTMPPRNTCTSGARAVSPDSPTRTLQNFVVWTRRWSCAPSHRPQTMAHPHTRTYFETTNSF